MSQTILVIAGGQSPSAHVVAELPTADYCIAADSGADHASIMGHVPDLVIGDLDSVSPFALAWAARGGAVVERYPVAKDVTDLELAMNAAIDRLEDVAPGPDCESQAGDANGVGQIFVLAIDGVRADHVLANIMLIAHPRYARASVSGVLGSGRFVVVHGGTTRALHGTLGSLVSLLPVHGQARGVVTNGLSYPLGGEVLDSGSSRGVSNTMASTEAAVSVDEGTVVVIQPFAYDTQSHTVEVGLGPNQ